MKRLFEKYQSDLRGLLWLTLTVFLAVSLATYVASDPSLNTWAKASHPQNLCGYLGAFLADLLYQGFGLSAWVLILLMTRQAITSFSTLRRDRGESVQWWLDGVLLICVTTLLSLHFPNTRFFSGEVRIGGWVGHLIASGLSAVINDIGLSIVLWATFAGLVVVYTDRSWGDLLTRPREVFTRFWGWVRSREMNWSQWRGPRVISLASDISTPPQAKFFKIREREDVAEKPTEIEEESLSAPITGFLKEQLMPKARAARRLEAKIPRRVENWELPKLAMLEDPPHSRVRLDEREIKNKAKLLVEKLAQFAIGGEVVGIKPGPAVTLFEFKPAPDVKISKITDLADDLSLALSSESVRIIAPIPGRDVVGIETSNSQRESVFVKDIIVNPGFWNDDCKLPIAMGRKADGEPRIVDLRKMPHLLVAGTTGSGKSVFIVSMITGLLFRHSPKSLKLILVDPKQVDLAAFNELPHLVMPPIREAKKAVGALRWAIREMEKRYRSMSKFGARGLESFNEMVAQLPSEKMAEHTSVNGALEGSFHPESYYFQPLPYIVIVVEEFGDLMVVDKVNVEQAVVRLAQMARACGIHLVLAMQSPRKDVVTGLIKTNIPGRISFKVASKMDSRIILDEGGAERLLARGDMLFLAPGVPKPERHHGPFLSENEINAVVENWRSQGEPDYDAVAMKAIEGSGGGFDLDASATSSEGDFGDDEIKDDRYDEVIAWVASQKEVSASLLQRRFRLGYPRAARMIEIFETEGVVGPANGSKPRQVLIREMPK